MGTKRTIDPRASQAAHDRSCAYRDIAARYHDLKGAPEALVNHYGRRVVEDAWMAAAARHVLAQISPEFREAQDMIRRVLEATELPADVVADDYKRFLRGEL